ncbi:MAG: hypothetical protein H8E25_09260 [Planctomycetes bacterium]|nr:hypothetical protein [Planctomycetota bacterium]
MITSFILLGGMLLPIQQNDEVVRLHDGRVLIGVIESHNLDGFEFISAVDNGRLNLVWTDLFPGESKRLHEVFGYSNETVTPMAVAQRILLTSGKELIGRVLSETNSTIEFRVRDTRSTFPKQLLASPVENITVEASSILTAEQFYAERVLLVDTADSIANYNFAKELEVMLAFEHAQQHYLQALDIATTQNDSPLISRTNGALSLLKELIANQEEVAALENIKQLMYRQHFTNAELELLQYDSDFPAAAFKGEFNLLRDKFEIEREKAIINYLRRHWFMRVMAVLRKQSLDKNARLDSLITWVESEVPQLVRQQFIEELEYMHDSLTQDMITELWASRLDYSSNSHTAGYGDGTWILGADRARSGLTASAEDAAEQDGKTEQQREMEERMKRYLDNLKTQQRATENSDAEQRPEDWWKGAQATARLQWLLAYYSEYSGDYELTNVKFAYCPTCAGLGYLETLELGASGSARKRYECQTCHGVQVKRSLNFK